MTEITDEVLAAIRENITLCTPIIQSLVARIDRLEREEACEWVQRQGLYSGDDEYTTGCGYGWNQGVGDAEYCGRCGRKIKLGQDIRRTCGNSD